MAETLVGTRLHFLVGELSSCAEAVDLSSTELSADALSCLEAPFSLRWLRIGPTRVLRRP